MTWKLKKAHRITQDKNMTNLGKTLNTLSELKNKQGTNFVVTWYHLIMLCLDPLISKFLENLRGGCSSP